MSARTQEGAPDESFVDKVERIGAEDVARRELLWLRAMEKDDEESIACLESADSGLHDRMHRLLAERGFDPLAAARERQAFLARLQDERLDRF